jgi:hypothetical protein
MVTSSFLFHLLERNFAILSLVAKFWRERHTLVLAVLASTASIGAVSPSLKAFFLLRKLKA